ncbi:asparaginase [Pseudomonas sp. CFBP 8771]|uniref:asparaginase n=1 Tax=Pseudomonas sp. CFBP 8771 TaxID=2775285 RepID=UPI00177AB289|nr:asparaginase [Pseudomonas sp. CFBP 8771]MBD8605108.1 asparaginase [Pseudomonas sp. CFBP 8771]
MALPRLSVGALGGTISMQAQATGAGVQPSLSGQGMVDLLPELTSLAEVQVHTLNLLPSASLSFQALLEALEWARSCIAAGAVGVVLSQGTDTLEEAAFFLDLLWDLDEPLVLTGAMRAASHCGADGPANLLAASQVALAEHSRRRGVLVVINDQVHAASRVRKVAALAMDAFASAPYGPIGLMIEGRVHYAAAPAARCCLPYPTRTDHTVLLLEATLDADTLLLDRVVEAGYRGVVIGGFGAGHVSQRWAASLHVIARHMPVIVATRTGSGPTASGSYGFAGGELDLQAKGAVMGRFLCPRKCRILLWMLVGSGQEHDITRYLSQLDN